MVKGGVDVGGELCNFLGIRGLSEVGLEFFDGIGGGVDFVNSIDLGLVEEDFVIGEMFLGSEVIGLFKDSFPGVEEVGVVFKEGGEAGVEVEHLELVVGMEELLGFAWAMEVDPVFAEGLECA